MKFTITNKTTGVVTELTEDKFNELNKKTMFRNSFIFRKIDTGDSLKGMDGEKLIKKHNNPIQQPLIDSEKPKKNTSKK